jgi:hypothetical protein
MVCYTLVVVLLVVVCVMGLENILVWNVRGLNASSHRNAMQELVFAEHLLLVCIQETKLGVITNFDVIQLMGSEFEYVYLLAIHTCGGILVAWSTSSWS